METDLKTKELIEISNDKVIIQASNREAISQSLLSFLDASATGRKQETFYNSRAEQIEAMEKIHNAVFNLNRGLYGAMLLLPGVSDLSIQMGVQRFLSHRNEDNNSCLTFEQETQLINNLSGGLKADRMIKLFTFLKHAKVNNRRTRKLIITSILNSNQLEYWAVKYHKKLQQVLTHAWGKSRTVALRKVLEKKSVKKTEQAKDLLKSTIDDFLNKDNKKYSASVYQCICFILDGDRDDYTLPVLQAFIDSRTNIEAGANILPMEVLEGIRSHYHKNVPKSKVLELCKSTMTNRQAMKVQRVAKDANIEVVFDPTRLGLVELYVYALEQGMTKEIREAMNAKAKRTGETMPVKYNNVGIVVDTSLSMLGSREAKRRPLAIALAMRDVFAASSIEETFIESTNGKFDKWGLIQPSGDTAIAEALLNVMDKNPDVVYVITDGYENASAGRLDEVIGLLRNQLNIETPIFQVTPVMAAESAGIKLLSKSIAPMPISNPEGIALSLLRTAIEFDVRKGIMGLLNIVRPKLTLMSVSNNQKTLVETTEE